MKRFRLFNLALMASGCLLALLFLASFTRSTPVLGQLLTLLVILFEIFVPLEVIRRLGFAPRDFNIYAYNLESVTDRLLPPFKTQTTIDTKGLKKELFFFFMISVAVLVPYIIGYWLFFLWRAAILSQDLVFSFNLPPDLLLGLIMQILVVALPEELFFRGFLQSSFLKGGLSMPKTFILVNIIFALSHLANQFSPLRLLTFFPGLIFSYLVYKNRSLLSAILFHATCNIVGQILYASFFLRS
jgi:membrane protease YdiL (CAAX protease family)